MLQHEIPISEIKMIQLEMLAKLDQFCKDNKIEYSLSYGTLIGAIRHGGYIPWDDDIDIMMTRFNYEKFISSFGYEVKNNLKLLSFENSYFGFLKLIDYRTYIVEKVKYNIEDYGIWIDIFPIDKLPDPASTKGKFLILIARILIRMASLRAIEWKSLLLKKYSTPKTIIYCFVKAITMIFNINFFGKRLNSLLRSYKDQNCIYAGDLTLGPKKSFFMDINIFNNYKDVVFEKLNLRMIREYDAFLRNVYGDYMIPPPVSQRTPVHNYRAFWKKNRDT